MVFFSNKYNKNPQCFKIQREETSLKIDKRDERESKLQHGKVGVDAVAEPEFRPPVLVFEMRQE